jgi:hypothetical protein
MPLFDTKVFKESLYYFLFGAVTLVVALSWNNAFTALLEKYFPEKDNSVKGKFIYSIILTFLAVILAVLIGKNEFK